MSRHFSPQKLSYIMASHAYLDIIASLDRWLTSTSAELVLIPAHFLHVEGNFHFCDPISRILFTGDLGVSMMSGQEASISATSLQNHLPLMEGFHRRYMVSNKVLRLWVKMARQLDISMLVPQHGAPLAGKAIQEFFDWAENLACGVDLFDQSNYQLPTAKLQSLRGR